MPLNLELKARIRSCADAAGRAEEGGAERRGILRQVDTYFQVRNGRLKLREEGAGQAELIAYHRREETPERWSDYSKIAIGDPSVLKRALSETLGILVEVRKERTLYLYRGARVHLDKVETLGEFVEFEVPAGGGSDAEGREAQRIMHELRALFGVRDEEIEKRSYSDLILASPVSSGK